MYRLKGAAGLLRLNILIFASAVVAAGDHCVLCQFPLTDDSLMQWSLPGRLNEISGLALTQDQRLLTVDDEVGIVYELNYDDGRLVKAFALGKPTVKNDFEGIAVLDQLVYLVTSKGRLYVAAEGADGQRVSFDNWKTGLGKQCEIEGLAQSDSRSRLYLLCKGVYRNADIVGLTIFSWSPARQQVMEDESVLLPAREIAQKLRVDRISPTGLTIDADSGNFIIVAARERALIEITEDGKLVEAKKFTLDSRHRQAEGIELTSDGRLLITDEGGTHKARLAVYRQEQDKRRQ